MYSDLDNFCALPEGCQAQYLRNPSNNHGYAKPGMEQFDTTKKVPSIRAQAALRHMTFNMLSDPWQHSIAIATHPSMSEKLGNEFENRNQAKFELTIFLFVTYVIEVT